jgi:hypothetical protein
VLLRLLLAAVGEGPGGVREPGIGIRARAEGEAGEVNGLELACDVVELIRLIVTNSALVRVMLRNKVCC